MSAEQFRVFLTEPYAELLSLVKSSSRPGMELRRLAEIGRRWQKIDNDPTALHNLLVLNAANVGARQAEVPPVPRTRSQPVKTPVSDSISVNSDLLNLQSFGYTADDFGRPPPQGM